MLVFMVSVGCCFGICELVYIVSSSSCCFALLPLSNLYCRILVTTDIIETTRDTLRDGIHPVKLILKKYGLSHLSADEVFHLQCEIKQLNPTDLRKQLRVYPDSFQDKN